MNNNCPNCKVRVSEDLRFCPLCGKFVANNKEDHPVQMGNSFPNVYLCVEYCMHQRENKTYIFLPHIFY